MKKLVVAVCIVSSILCAKTSFADEWTNEDTAYQAAIGALLLVDYTQVRQWTSTTKGDPRCDCMPTAFFDAQRSSPQWFYPTAFVLQTAFAYMLPQPYRRYSQFVTMGFQSGIIFGNYFAGYKFTF